MKELGNDSLEFDEAKHKYSVNGKEFTSVTRFIRTLFPPFDAKAIGKKLADSQKMRNGGKFKRGEEITELERKKATQKYWKEEWQRAADLGTELHKMMEDYFLAEKDLVNMDYPDRVQKGIEYVQTYLNTGDDVTWYPEIRVFSEEYGLAGTADLLTTGDGKTVLSDWKFTKKISTRGFDDECGIHQSTRHLDSCKVNTYGLQLMIYAFILKHDYGVVVDELHLVHLLDDKYTIYIIDYDEVLVLSVLEGLK